MKQECHSCPHRLELNPEYKELPWDKTPCSECFKKSRVTVHLPYDENVYYHFDDNGDISAISLLSYIFKCWLQLRPMERSIVSERVIRPELTDGEIARIHNISRVTLYKAHRRIIREFPALKEFLKRNSKKRKKRCT